MRTALALIAAVVIVGCNGTSASRSPASQTSLSTPIAEWPTVLELRTALADDYELVRDIADDGHVRWSEAGASTSVEILGKDTELAEVTVSAAIEAGHDGHLDIVVAHFPAAVGQTAVEAVAEVRAKLPTTGLYDHAEVIKPTQGGTIDVDGFPDQPPIFVFFKPKP